MQTLGSPQRSRQAAHGDGLPPGLAHQRLTPGNAADLLFDDVLWVQEAQKDHFDFVLKMRERGTEVIDLHEMLAETLADKTREVGSGATNHDQRRRPGRGDDSAWLDEMLGTQAGRAPDRRHRDPRPAEEGFRDDAGRGPRPPTS